MEQRYGSPILLPARPELQGLLAARVPADAVRHGCTVRAAGPAGSRAVVSGVGPVGGFEVEADLVVAADGVHSSLRALVDPRAAARHAGHTAWRALVPAALASRVADSGDSWGRGQRFGYAPMGDGGVYWFASAVAAAGGVAGPDELQALCERFAGWHEPIPALLAATPPAALLRNDVLQLDPPPRRLAARAHRAARRCGPRDDAGPGPGRLPGAGGCRRAGRRGDPGRPGRHPGRAGPLRRRPAGTDQEGPARVAHHRPVGPTCNDRCSARCATGSCPPPRPSPGTARSTSCSDGICPPDRCGVSRRRPPGTAWSRSHRAPRIKRFHCRVAGGSLCRLCSSSCGQKRYARSPRGRPLGTSGR